MGTVTEDRWRPTSPDRTYWFTLDCRGGPHRLGSGRAGDPWPPGGYALEGRHRPRPARRHRCSGSRSVTASPSPSAGSCPATPSGARPWPSSTARRATTLACSGSASMRCARSRARFGACLTTSRRCCRWSSTARTSSSIGRGACGSRTSSLNGPSDLLEAVDREAGGCLGRRHHAPPRASPAPTTSTSPPSGSVACPRSRPRSRCSRPCSPKRPTSSSRLGGIGRALVLDLQRPECPGCLGLRLPGRRCRAPRGRQRRRSGHDAGTRPRHVACGSEHVMRLRSRTGAVPRRLAVALALGRLLPHAVVGEDPRRTRHLRSCGLREVGSGAARSWPARRVRRLGDRGCGRRTTWNRGGRDVSDRRRSVALGRRARMGASRAATVMDPGGSHRPVPRC